MDDPGLMVIGASPGGCRSAPSTPRKSFGQTFVKHINYSYTDRLFGEVPHGQQSRPPSAQGSARSDSSQNTKNSYLSKNKNKHHESYVDEMLFGPKLSEPEFAAPWEKPSKKPIMFDMTDYKSLKPRKAVLPESANKKKPMKANHNMTFVDKGLFNNNAGKERYNNPWNGKVMKTSSMADDYGTALPEGLSGMQPPRTPTRSRPPSRDGSRPPSRDGSRPPSRDGSRPPSRDGSRQDVYQPTSSRPQTPINSQKKNKKPRDKHQPSYVDEMLFGPKPIEPDFPAPWEKKDKRPWPHVFDASNLPYAGHGGGQSRPQSAGKCRTKATNAGQKPAWK